MNGAGNDNADVKPLAEYLEPVAQDEATELAEELADTVIIEQLVDKYIQETSEMFYGLLDLSMEGNPVKTHFALQSFGDEIINSAYILRSELIAKLANRAEEFAEKGDHLRKQVVDEQSEES